MTDLLEKCPTPECGSIGIVKYTLPNEDPYSLRGRRCMHCLSGWIVPLVGLPAICPNCKKGEDGHSYSEFGRMCKPKKAAMP